MRPKDRTRRGQGTLDAVYDGSREFGFGAAVKAALEFDAANFQKDADTISLRAVSAQDTHWLWLLHDDAVPAPDALYQLLAHVTTDQSIDLTRPKLHRASPGAASPISEIGVAFPTPGIANSTRVDEIDRGGATSLRSGRRLPLRHVVGPPSGVNWTVLTLPCRSSGMASVADALTSTATAWSPHLLRSSPPPSRPCRASSAWPYRAQAEQVDRLLGALGGRPCPERMLPLVWLRLVWATWW